MAPGETNKMFYEKQKPEGSCAFTIAIVLFVFIPAIVGWWNIIEWILNKIA